MVRSVVRMPAGIGSAGQGSVHRVTPKVLKGAPAASVCPSGASSGKLLSPPGEVAILRLKKAVRVIDLGLVTFHSKT